MIRFGALCAAFVVGSGAAALDLPGAARLTRETVAEQDSYAVPVGAFANENIPTRNLIGAVRRQAWQIDGNGQTPFQIIQPLQIQLSQDGYRPDFDCDTDRCGGFDFRFGIDVLAAPYMFVNLRQFHFMTLLKGPEGAPTSAVMLLASTTQDLAYLQVVEVSRDASFATEIKPSAPIIKRPSPVVNTDAAPDLLAQGSIVLDGLEFETGATTLGAGPFAGLVELAAFLKANPELRVALVGHTDSVGSLDGNIRISKQRAQAVRQRLIDTHNIRASQLDAEGMGYLAPRASNLNASGREANRRVEVIVLTTQ
ncbi:MAG: OmpA family protein [Aliishimia sp.]